MKYHTLVSLACSKSCCSTWLCVNESIAHQEGRFYTIVNNSFHEILETNINPNQDQVLSSSCQTLGQQRESSKGYVLHLV